MKILYLYNKEDWALHNVGKLWFEPLENNPNVQINLRNYHTIDNILEVFENYDYIWFSYLYMYMKFKYNPSRSIVTIHDPMEIFEEVPNWKDTKILEPQLDILKTLKHITTISTELHKILLNYGIEAFQIPTTSLLPLINQPIESSEKSEYSKILTISNSYPRKNFNLMYAIQKTKGLREFYTTKIGLHILSNDDYIKLIDSHQLYICTSFQEGGPLPAMDAMSRGLAVLTTPVGQMNELIIDGFSTCPKTKKSFLIFPYGIHKQFDDRTISRDITTFTN